MNSLKRCIERGLFVIPFFVLFLSLLPGVFAGCCTASTNPSVYCQEFDSSPADCQQFEDTTCAATSCSSFGCCEDSCGYTEKRQCFNSVFHAFTECSEVEACVVSCCIVNGVPQEGLGLDPSSCQGEFHPGKTCSEVPGFGNTFGSVSGSVLEFGTNEPLAGVQIQLGSLSGLTNANGAFSFSSVPIGNYVISATLPNYEFRDQIPFPLVVTSGQDHTVTITMDYDALASSVVSGKVRDIQTGFGLSGALVTLEGGFSSFTNDQGEYSITSSLAEGTYSLRATKNGYSNELIAFELTPGNTYDNVNFDLNPLPDTNACGDGVRNFDEECDFPDDSACPGSCISPGNTNECTCEASCEDRGFFCADQAYQCLSQNGRIQSDYNNDCDTPLNGNNGVCCDTEPTIIPECIAGEGSGAPSISFTDTEASGGSFCVCGTTLADTDASTADNQYCCTLDGTRQIKNVKCAPPANLEGTVSFEGSPLSDVTIQLNSLYFTLSDSSSPNYELFDLGPGTYTLRATKPGFSDFVQDITLEEGESKTFDFSMTERQGLDVEITLTPQAIQGSPHVNLVLFITDTVAVGRYDILRDGVFIKTITNPGFTEEFVDTTTSWQQEYSYTVVVYSDENQFITEDESLFRTGDPACEGVNAQQHFCGTSTCFSSGLAETCYDVSGPFTYQLRCTEDNFVRFATGKSDTSICETGSCVAINGRTLCSEDTTDSCEILGTPASGFTNYNPLEGNIFGLFYPELYNRESCERIDALSAVSVDNYKYCYYDSFASNVIPLNGFPSRYVGTYTTVDQCLSCEPQGFCYDYQSQGACERDNCAYGENYGTSCSWQWTDEELGKGFCYSEDTTSPKYCELCDVTNPVFYNFECTQEVCSQLGGCIARPDNSACSACSPTTTCSTFDGNEQACLGSGTYEFQGFPQQAGLTCGSSTIISKGDDVCGIGYCSYVGGNCIKDANLDGIDDCLDSSDETLCEQDATVPLTSLSSQALVSTFFTTLSFSIDSAEESYYCLSSPGAYCCPSSTLEATLTLPNLDYPELEGVEETKTLWYYSVSSGGNPEPIKSNDVYIDTLPPQFNLNVGVSDSSLALDLSDITIEINSHESMKDCRDELYGRNTQTRLYGDYIAEGEQKIVTYSGLPDGNYIYAIECQDLYGNYNRTEQTIVLDRIKLIENVYPHSLTLNTETTDFSITTGDVEYSCTYQQLEPTTGPVSSYEDVSFTGVYTYLTQGVTLPGAGAYSYDVICYVDESQTIVADTSLFRFTVDTLPPSSELLVSRHGEYILLDEDDYYFNPVLKISCTDPVQGPPREFGCSRIEYCFGQTTCDPSSGQVATGDFVEFSPNVDTGRYFVCYSSLDAGDNKEDVTCKTVHVDQSQPGLSITSPASGSVLGNPTVSFSGTWLDEQVPTIIAKVTHFNEDGTPGHERIFDDVSVLGNQGQGTFSGILSLSNAFAGLNTLQVYATDASGNTKSDTINFYLDIYGPTFEQALIFADSYVAPQGSFSSTNNGPLELETALFPIVENGNTISHLEFGRPFLLSVFFNDDRYTDMNFIFDEDVSVLAEIYKHDPSEFSLDNLDSAELIISRELLFNETSLSYGSYFTDLLELGNYSIVYTATDTFGYETIYTQPFFVNDTLPPFFTVTIYDEHNQEVTDLVYGSYSIAINSSEPLEKLFYLNYSVNGKTKFVELLDTQGQHLRGFMRLAPTDLDLLNLDHALATFSILGEDLHENTGDFIISTREFYITSEGPLQPQILTPPVNTVDGAGGNGQNSNSGTALETTFYVNQNPFTVEGIVFEDGNLGLSGEQVIFMKNSLSGDITDSNWNVFGNTFTTASTFRETWDPRQYNDEIVYKSPTLINLHDYDDIFTVGHYFELVNTPQQNKKLYRIVSRSFTTEQNGKRLYDITFDPPLQGFDNLLPGNTFADDIVVYDTPTPDGWFSLPVTIDQGHNYFYVRSFEGDNEGTPSVIFDLVIDQEPPVLINVSPRDQSILGDRHPYIYAHVDPTFSPVDIAIMLINGEEVPVTLSETLGDAVRIEHLYSGDLPEGQYDVNLFVQDKAGNTLNSSWTFAIDYSAPFAPIIRPSGPININLPLIEIIFPHDVVISEATLFGNDISYELDLTNKLSYSEGSGYTYQLAIDEALVEGSYSITLLARRIINGELGEEGFFSEDFRVDMRPPRVVSITDPAHNALLPVVVEVVTDEPTLCRYGYTEANYDQLPYGNSALGFTSQHTLRLYDLPALRSTLYVSCIDEAGNVMIDPATSRVSVDSLLLPPPAIYIPESTLTVVPTVTYDVIGSTFDEPNPLFWVPDVSVVVSKSNLLFTSASDFEQRLFTTSLPTPEVVAVPESTFILSDDYSIIIRDSTSVFSPGLFVDFAANRRSDYRFYSIESVSELSSAFGPDMVKVTFAEKLPLDLSTSQQLYLFNQRAPGGWFTYPFPLDEGLNFFYASALNSFGEGKRTEVYTLLKDTTPPRLFDELPRQGEIVAEEVGVVSIIADGTFSEIERAEFTIDGLPVLATLQQIRDFESLVRYDGQLSNGFHNVKAYVEDEAQNSAEKTWTFTISSNVPRRPLMKPSDATNDSTPLLEILFQEQVTLTSAKISGGRSFDFTSTAQNVANVEFTHEVTTPLPEGEYELEVQASKITQTQAGLWKERFLVDLTPPIITEIPTSIITSSLPVDFLFVTNEYADCRFSEFDTPYYSMQGILDSEATIYHFVSVPLSTSRAFIYIRCRDIAGNVMGSSKVVAVNQELTNPPVCGDAIITHPEECDGSNVGEITSCSLYNPGFVGGSLSCDPNTCRFDTSQCTTCSVDSDCPNGSSCEDGLCTFTPECTDHSECPSNHICDFGTCHPIDPVCTTTEDCLGNYVCVEGFCQPPGTECTITSDCPSDEVCVNGNCNPSVPECTTNAECPVDQICQFGECVIIIDGCTTDFQCGTDEFCFEGACVPQGTECLTDVECPSDERCVEGICISETPNCQANADCLQNEVCLNNFCTPIDPPCIQDSDCSANEICYENYCLPPGTQCTIDNECSANEICLNGNCLPETPQCTENNECLLDQICYFGDCKPIEPFCEIDSDCFLDYTCVNNLCVPQNGPCFTDFDCGATEYCIEEVCVPAIVECGNNRVEPGETCDGSNFGPIFDCSDLDGFSAGELTCDSTCHFDTSACTTLAVCGDGIKHASEQCEPGLLTNLVCSDLGFASGGTIGCTSSCTYDTTTCVPDAICGDGIITPGEQCDGSLDDKTCSDLDGFTGGELACNSACQFNTTACTKEAVCGNGVIELGETCDGDIETKTCGDFNLNGEATVRCSSTCNYDTSVCEQNYVCGNGLVEPGESCDLGGVVGDAYDWECSDFGLTPPTSSVLCTLDCQFDYSNCDQTEGVCGDGTLNLGETCEVIEPFIGERYYEDHACTELMGSGRHGVIVDGFVTCDNCVLDTSNCDIGSICGNSIVQPGEECDVTADLSCTDFDGFSDGELRCDTSCLYNTSNCLQTAPVCGNNVIEPGEECEVGQITNTCTDFDNFIGGSLGCSDTCQYDTSQCMRISTCGDGFLDQGEQCDGSLQDYECSAYESAYDSGTVVCDNCLLSFEGCTIPAVCGNGVLEPGEECDGSIGLSECQDFDRFLSGSLGCSDTCQYDTSFCIADTRGCGNGIVEPGEQCDPLEPVSVTCNQFDSYLFGEIYCSASCIYDISECSKVPIYSPECGNGQIDEELGEQCESTIILATCSDLGFDAPGSPGCYSEGSAFACNYDVTACGGTLQCEGNEERFCDEINPLYVEGVAKCDNGFYNMSTCFSLDLPIISTTIPPRVSSNTFTIEGTVQNTEKLELYINGELIGEREYIYSTEQAFTFLDVYLARSTQTSDGVNDVMLIAYGGTIDNNITLRREVIVDVVGPTITIDEPINLRTTDTTPTIFITTSKPASCSISYTSSSDQSVVDSFVVQNGDSYGTAHEVILSETLYSDTATDITIICEDEFGNDATLDTTLFVDVTRPAILDVLLQSSYTLEQTGANFKNIALYAPLNTQLGAMVDSLSWCRYGIDFSEYDDMTDFDPTATDLSTEWITSENVSSTLNNFTIRTICQDESGLLSDPYVLTIRVDPNLPLEITNKNPRYTNDQLPLLIFETNRPAVCEISYDGQTEELSRSTSNTLFEHSLPSSQLDLLFEENQEYTLEVFCEAIDAPETVVPITEIFTIGADFTIPFIDITYPSDFDVFNTEAIDVQISTEALTTVELFVNNDLVSEGFTEDGTLILPVLLDKGANTIEAVATDKASNTNSTSILVYSKADAVAPQVQGTFPEDQGVVNTINTLTADIWTVFGAQLDLEETELIVINTETGQTFGGIATFTRGTEETDFVGKLIFTLDTFLENGRYEWKITPLDEFGTRGLTTEVVFTVDDAVPVIILNSPLNASSSSDSDTVYHTRDNKFVLKGYVQSRSPLVEVTYTMKKDSTVVDTGNLGEFFDKTITLERLSTENEEFYTLEITALNTEGKETRYPFEVWYDLVSPLPIEVIIS